jgi:hypothetical protein
LPVSMYSLMSWRSLSVSMYSRIGYLLVF